jgi:hypothetical protein
VTETVELLEGVHLRSLDRGSVIDLETKSRHYRIEYMGGDRVRVSGHPQWCPAPVLAHLQGSPHDSGTFEPDFVGRGMHLVFRRLDDRLPVTTSEVMDIRLGQPRSWMVDGCKRLFGRH